MKYVNTVKTFGTRFPFCFALLLATLAPSTRVSAQTQRLRIVAYNIMDDVTQGTITFTTPLAGLIAPFTGTGTFTQNSSGTVTNGGALEGIGEEVVAGTNQPIDILALEETSGNSTTVQPILDGLNAFYSSRTNSARYAMSPLNLTTTGGDGGGPSALVYNTNTVQLLASVGVGTPSGSGIPRQVGRYLFAPAGVTTNAFNTFYVYVSHYKSGSDTNSLFRRGIEAGIIRTNSATLPVGSRVLYVGDYNVSTSTETSYQAIVKSVICPIGIQGYDFFNPSGFVNVDWTANSLLKEKTESGRSIHFRDDFQIMSSNVFFGAPGGLSYLAGTYHTFGNNGTYPYTSPVITSGNTALSTNLMANPPISFLQCYTNLYGASDHLPIVADYLIPTTVSPPVASFTASVTNGVPPLNVTFTDTSTGIVTNWFWDFGDGNTTNLPTAGVFHSYATAGVYTVTEIVFGAGSSTNTQNNYITVTGSAPVASFSGAPTSGTEPLLVTFTDASTGSITNWFWDFGNGSTTNFAVSTNPAQTYTAGTYTVSLTVSGPGGNNTQTLTSYINVLTAFQSWQVQYFGSTTNPAAAMNADPDGDGQSNLAEFLSGTNPTNSASSLRITSIVAQSNNVLVTWTTAGGATNVVQATAGLPDGSYTSNFLDLSPLIILPGSGDTTTNYLDNGGATNNPSRYYRIRVQP